MDIKLGWKLLKDNRVPIRAKLAALGIGAACIAALEGLELPLDAVLGQSCRSWVSRATSRSTARRRPSDRC